VDWKHRHAALWSILVFLKQMDPLHAANSLKPIFPLIRSFLRDTSSSRIRSTALWVTSWMVEKCPLLLFNSNSQDLHQLVNDLVTSLKDEEGRVSPSSCIALMSVIKAAYSVAMAQQKVSTKITFACKNSYSHNLIEKTKQNRWKRVNGHLPFCCHHIMI
jgi:hypothetical protein